MSRLIDRIRGDGRRDGVTDTHIGRETSPGLGGSDGFGFAQADKSRVWDVVHNELDGQPPVAESKGWCAPYSE